MEIMQQYGLYDKKKFSINYFIIVIVGFTFSAIVALHNTAQYLGQFFPNTQTFLGYYPFWKAPSWCYQAYNYTIFDTALNIFCMWFLPPVFLLTLYALYSFFPKGNKKLHGTANWASKKEIKEIGYLSGKGVYVGGYQDKDELLYLRHNGPEHILTFAPTRSGKGVGLIIPTLLAWEGSSIILDIKGENWALTAGYRQSLGHKVIKFDPTCMTDASAHFNPLEEVDFMNFGCIKQIQNIALMLVDPDGKGLTDYWNKAGYAFLAGALLHCLIVTKEKHKRTATMQDLVFMLAGNEEPLEELFKTMVATKHGELLASCYESIDPQIGIECHNFILSAATEMQQKGDQEVKGVVSSALVNLSLYRDPIVNKNTQRSDFRLHDLMNHEQPVDLYLVLSPAEIDRIKPLIRLMVDLIIRHVCREMEFKDGRSVQGYKHRMLLMLDEFTSIGKLPIIEKAIAYIAGYGGKMYLIVQDLGQLNEAYGKENSLMANCHVRIAYAPNKLETAQMLSEMTGKTTVVDEKTSISYSKGGKSRSVNIQETARALLTPDECMRLPSPKKDSNGNVTEAGDMLILTAGRSPIYGKQILYFKDPVFMTRAKMQAPEKTDSIYFERDTPNKPTKIKIQFSQYVSSYNSEKNNEKQ